jgi:hypothetical protein
MTLRTTRNIKRGEQLFVMYDGYVRDTPIEARRKRLKKWLDADCLCTRCVREAAEAQRVDEKMQGSLKRSWEGSESSWDTDDKPVFPEDKAEWEVHPPDLWLQD